MERERAHACTCTCACVCFHSCVCLCAYARAWCNCVRVSIYVFSVFVCRVAGIFAYLCQFLVNMCIFTISRHEQGRSSCPFTRNLTSTYAHTRAYFCDTTGIKCSQIAGARARRMPGGARSLARSLSCARTRVFSDSSLACSLPRWPLSQAPWQVGCRRWRSARTHQSCCRWSVSLSV